MGEALGEWQAAELRIARAFAECRGLALEQVEDIYQETALALLARPYASEEHLRNALRHGIKNRALNMHRDTRRRAQILQQSAPSMQRIAEARESQIGPEEAALQDQDRLIVREFLTELDELEQRVFWLIADGMRYRAIASMLGVRGQRGAQRLTVLRAQARALPAALRHRPAMRLPRSHHPRTTGRRTDRR